VRPLLTETGRREKWNYESGWPPSYEAFGRLRALLAISEALSFRPKRVLEVAACDGALSAVLAQYGCEVVANDLRGDELTTAVARFSNRRKIGVLPGDILELDPSRTGLFDLVVACEIVEHVAHTRGFLAKLRRFLAPGAHILLTTPNGAYFRNRLPTHSEVTDFSILEAKQFKPDADGHLFLITPGELRLLANQAGLRVDRIELWATPLTTGHCGLRRFASPVASRFSYRFERSCQWLPSSAKEKLCFALSAVLSSA
jgi:2-polyprenyl-3-methyl-5-hydroxy-6-metoxy-1,4-benzoquinol methylase